MSRKYHYYYHGANEESGCFLAFLFCIGIGLISAVVTFISNYGLIILSVGFMVLAICKTITYCIARKTKPTLLECSICSSNNTRIFQQQTRRKTKQFVKCANCGFVWNFHHISDINRRKISSITIAIISYVISIISILLYVYPYFLNGSLSLNSFT